MPFFPNMVQSVLLATFLKYLKLPLKTSGVVGFWGSGADSLLCLIWRALPLVLLALADFFFFFNAAAREKMTCGIR